MIPNSSTTKKYIKKIHIYNVLLLKFISWFAKVQEGDKLNDC